MSLTRATVTALLVTTSFAAVAQQQWKNIRYLDGLVEFQIPATWVAQYDEWDRGTYYEDSDDSGILRIDVSTLNSTQPLDERSAVDLLIALDTEAAGEFSELPGGNALHRYTQIVVEDDYELLIYWWVVAKIIDRHHVRLANFSYTILADNREQPVTKAMVDALAHRLSQSQIGSDISAIVVEE